MTWEHLFKDVFYPGSSLSLSCLGMVFVGGALGSSQHQLCAAWQEQLIVGILPALRHKENSNKLCMYFNIEYP